MTRSELHRISQLIGQASVTMHGPSKAIELLAAGGRMEVRPGRTGRLEVYERVELTIDGCRFVAGRFRNVTREELVALLHDDGPPENHWEAHDVAREREMDKGHAA